MSRFAAKPLSTNRELERAIADAPYDEERWVVLEDWLLERDDPRGVIVQLEKAGRRGGAARVRRRLHPQLLGEDHAALAASLYLANWRAGYVRECTFASADIALLPALCRAPAAMLLRALTLTIFRSQLGEAMRELAASALADTLHDLTISNVHVDPPIVTGEMLAALPRLRRLALRGAYVGAGTIAGITSLLVAPTRYDLAHLGPFLQTVRFEAVTEVVLDLANLADPDIDALILAPLFAGQHAPRLAQLQIRHATPQVAHDARQLLATSPLRFALAIA